MGMFGHLHSDEVLDQMFEFGVAVRDIGPDPVSDHDLALLVVFHDLVELLIEQVLLGLVAFVAGNDLAHLGVLLLLHHLLLLQLPRFLLHQLHLCYQTG